MGHGKLKKFAENETFRCLLQPSAASVLVMFVAYYFVRKVQDAHAPVQGIDDDGQDFAIGAQDDTE